MLNHAILTDRIYTQPLKVCNLLFVDSGTLTQCNAASRVPRRNGTIGLSSLGDDQFDGLAQLSKLLQARKDNSKSSMPFTRPPSKVHVAGIMLKLQPSPSGEPPNPFKGKFSSRPRQSDSTEQNKHSAERSRDNGNRESRRKDWVEKAAKSKETSGGTVARAHPDKRAISRPANSDETRPSKAPSSLHLTPSTKAAAVKSNSPARSSRGSATPSHTARTAPTDILGFKYTPPSLLEQLNALLPPNSKHHLEQHAGDYSRYLPEDFARAADVSTMGPVGHAKLNFARRWDVSLRQRRNAIDIVSRVAGTGNTQNTTGAA